MTVPGGAERRPWAMALALIGLQWVNLAAWALGGYVHGALFLLLLLALLYACLRDLREGWTIVALMALLAVTILGSPLSAWDARSIWFFHAKEIYFQASLYAPLDGYGAFSHNDYPVMLPALAASLARSVGAWNEIFPRLALLLLLAPVLVLWRLLVKSDLAYLLAFALMLLACDERIVSGYLDAPLALYLAAAALLLGNIYRPADDARAAGAGPVRWQLMALFAVMAMLPHLKNEGLLALAAVYACLLPKAVSALPGRPPARRAAQALLWSLPLLAYVALWWLPVRSHGIAGDLFPPGVLQRAASRLSSAADLGLILASEFEQLRVPLLLLAAALVLARWCPASRRASLRAPLAFLGLYLAGITLVYCVTPHELAWQLGDSVDRTMLAVNLGILAGLAWSFERAGIDAGRNATQAGPDG